MAKNSKNITVEDTILDERVEILDSIDSMCSEECPRYFAKGEHIVTVCNWEYHPKEEVKSRTGDYVKKPFVLLDLLDSKTGEVQETKLYPGFVPYFFNQISAQTEGAVGGMKLSEVLAYLGNHEFSVWVSYSKENGVQVAYQAPRE